MSVAEQLGEDKIGFSPNTRIEQGMLVLLFFLLSALLVEPIILLSLLEDSEEEEEELRLSVESPGGPADPLRAPPGKDEPRKKSFPSIGECSWCGKCKVWTDHLSGALYSPCCKRL
jgi:hypothetical protein